MNSRWASIKNLLTKFGYLVYVIALLFLSTFVFGVGVTWLLQTVGIPTVLSGTIASQLSIVIFGLSLFEFNKLKLKEIFKNKYSFDAFWKGVKLTIVILIINLTISNLIAVDNTGIPESTQSVLDKSSFLMTFLFPVIIAPFFEELAFRAGIKSLLVDKASWKPVMYVITSSIIFGMLHWTPGSPTALSHVLLTLLMGVVYSIVYLKTDNLCIPIASHMIYNGLVITAASLL